MTLTNLKLAVLERLGIIQSGEPVSAEDVDLVGRRYASLLSLLTTETLVDWIESEDIPEDAEAIMVPMVAAECLHDFGITDQTLLIEGKFGGGVMSVAERLLRRRAAKGYVPQPARSDYF